MNTDIFGLNFDKLLPLGCILGLNFIILKVKSQKVVLQKLNLQHLITANIYDFKVIFITERASNGNKNARIKG